MTEDVLLLQPILSKGKTKTKKKKERKETCTMNYNIVKYFPCLMLVELDLECHLCASCMSEGPIGSAILWIKFRC